MPNNNPNWGDGDPYDPEVERCCKDCGKTFKTKEGVKHGKYDFHCSECHIYWKKFWQNVTIGTAIGGAVIFLLMLFLVWKWLNSKKKCKNCVND